MRPITRRSTLLAGGAAFTAGTAHAEGETGDFGLAPEFAGINAWLNSEPLTMAGLRGKVVLIDFWTYSCINCLRTLPYVTRWYDTYRDRGLVVVGVHTPEFAFERLTPNVRTAISRFGINYPVAQDNAMATWNAYENRYWPAEYLIDRSGRIVRKHFGEGGYGEMETAIRTLLAAGPPVPADEGVDRSRIGSPEMYFGADRIEALGNAERPRRGEQAYTAPATLPLNHFALVGTWDLAGQHATLQGGGGAVLLHFNAAKVFLVAGSASPVTLSINVDDKPQSPVTIGESRMYTLFDSNDYRPHTLALTIPKAGLEAFSFTFG